MTDDRPDPVVADLERLRDLDDATLLGHVHAAHLIAYAERRADGTVREYVEDHLRGCEVCRDALERVEATASDWTEADDVRRRPALWDVLRRTVLAPAPALAYLLLLAVGLAWWGTRPPSGTISGTLPTTVPLFAADPLRGSASEDVPVVVPWATGTEVVLVVHTDVLPGEADGGLTVRVTAGDDAIVERALPADRIPDDGVLSVILPARDVRPGVVYRVRVEGPGAPPFNAAYRFPDRP